MRALPFASILLGATVLTPLVTAQTPVGVVPVDGPATYLGRYDLTTHTIDATPAPPGGVVVYDNTNLSGSFFTPGAGLYSMDWGTLAAAPFSQITDLQIAYATTSLVPISTRIRVHAGATGFGVQGATVADVTVTGLPGSANGQPAAFIIDLDLEGANLDFYVGDGPIGYSYEFFNASSGPFIPNPPHEVGVQDAFDRYTSAGAYISTNFFGGNPKATFYFQMTAIEPPECFLVIGPAPGSAAFQYGQLGHVFNTQVAAVNAWYPVLMEDIPEFVIESVSAPRFVVQPGGSNPLLNGQIKTGIPTGMYYDMAVQVLMWNPQVFPSQPEQYTNGLAVRIFSNGRVVTAPYGTSQGGMEIWAETGLNAQGKKVVSFPFSIPGF